MPDDYEDGAGDGDEGFLFAAAFDQPPVAFAEEGVGLRGCGGDLPEDPFEVGVALAGLAFAVLRAGLDGARAQFRPGHQVPGGREPAHVQPDLRDDDLGAAHGDAGDLVETLEGRYARGEEFSGRGVGTGVGVGGGWWPGGGDGRDRLVDLAGELVDLGAQGVVLVEQHPGQVGVVGVEPAGQRFDQRGLLDPHPALGQGGQPPRVAFSADQRLDHRPAGDPEDVGGHGRQLDQGVFEQLLHPLPDPGPVGGNVDTEPGVVTQVADLGRGYERGPQHAPFGELGQPYRVELVGLGPARYLLDLVGVDQPHVQASRLQQVVERPPDYRCGLQHDPLDALAD